MSNITLEDGYKEACFALGESIVRERITNRFLAEKVNQEEAKRAQEEAEADTAARDEANQTEAEYRAEAEAE